MTSGPARVLVARLANCPFILDSGHISPERSDFKSLRAIAPHPIQGFNGSSTNALGIGDIDLVIASGHKLSLKDVLYVPSCDVRLISVPSLDCGGYALVGFGRQSCWVADKNDKIIVRGSLCPTRSLYFLHCDSARVSHSRPKQMISSSALYAKRTPDVETWHRRLGHCNTRTIIDMARNKIAKGMPIDLSSSPPKCNHCMLGKQTRSPVPKMSPPGCDETLAQSKYLRVKQSHGFP